MDDVIREANAAAEMIEDLTAMQNAKAEKAAEARESVHEAMDMQKKIAADVVAGKKASVPDCDPAGADPSLNPELEAAEAVRMTASIAKGKLEKEAKHADAVANADEKVLEEVVAASQITDSIAASEAKRSKGVFARMLDAVKGKGSRKAA